MSLFLIIFIVCLGICGGAAISMIMFINRTTNKAFKYSVTWVLWGLSIFFLLTSKVPEMDTTANSIVKLLFESASLLFIGLAFTYLDGIFRGEYTGKIMQLSYIIFSVQFIAILPFVFIFKDLFPLLLYTIVIIVRLGVFSIYFKRYFFLSMVICFFLFFSWILVVRVLGVFFKIQDIIEGWKSWLPVIPAIIFAIIGTWKNGEGH